MATKEQIIAERSIATERYILSTLPILYLPLYRLDSGQSGDSFISADGIGHLCTVTGALWRPNGRAFDDTDDFISVPHSSIFDFAGDDFTIIAWIKQNDTGINIVMSQTKNNTNRTWVLYLSAVFNFVASTDGLTWDISMNSGSVSTDIWYQVGVTRIESTFTKYLNAEIVETTTEAGALHTEVSTFKIGRDFDSGGTFSNSTIGEVLYYNKRGLSPPEIQNIYVATKWRYQ